MICPFCEQGTVLEAIIKVSQEQIYICPECDTVWVDIDAPNNATTLEKYLKRIGLKDSWDELFIYREYGESAKKE